MGILRCITVCGLLTLLIACNEFPGGHDNSDYYRSSEPGLSGLYDLSDNGGGSDNRLAVLAPHFDAAYRSKKETKADRKVIRNGELVFEVDDLGETRKDVQDLLTTHKGYISSEREYSYSNRTSVTIVVRVEASSFDRLLADVSTDAITIDEKEVSNKDVTEEFLDVETRLKNKKTLEARYLELLKSAKTVKDILDIEKEMGTLREDIESVEGRLNYIKDQTSMSTLTITFYVENGQSTHFFRSIGNGFRNGLDNLGRFLIGLVNVWPFVILLIVGILIVRRSRAK